ncbi:predicted protein [Chaetomium globosum CBS 148.51]|uniref:Uncharacterized protein n=1 Tax=Chaetomium globosum (strain ATCC 6205 / CBS 148.51 / DSM 1962 / NBRC 6347 / NRRL 1970) TaxID=306901 RepID=Q2GZ92_CHAGB|nr:uncharacterized protein CHGG_05154 [Chaetomium globosum CBS 148.51]EAQ88535.1 predicted protein [Chaetomium globosum CBS 148.51]
MAFHHASITKRKSVTVPGAHTNCREVCSRVIVSAFLKRLLKDCAAGEPVQEDASSSPTTRWAQIPLCTSLQLIVCMSTSQSPSEQIPDDSEGSGVGSTGVSALANLDSRGGRLSWPIGG